MANNAVGDIKNLQSAWEDLGITIFDQKNGVLRGTLQTITDMVRAVGTWAKENPNLSSSLTTLVGASGLLLIALGGIALSVAAILSPFAMMGTATTGIATVSALASSAMGVIGSVIGAVALPAVLAIAAAGVALYKFWEPIKAFLGGFWEGFVAAAGPIGELLSSVIDAFRPAIELFKEMFGWVKSLIEPIQLTKEGFADISSWGKIAGEVVGKIFDVILLPIRTVISMIRVAVESLVSLVKIGNELSRFNFSGAIKEITAGGSRIFNILKNPESYVGKTKPVAAATASRTPPVVQAGPSTFQIYAAPGMNPADIANLVDQKMQQRNAALLTRSRSRLTDND